MNKKMFITIILAIFVFNIVPLNRNIVLADSVQECDYVIFENSTEFQNQNIENTNKRIYLTFDDGPSKKVTLDILSILKKHNVKATFFVVGNQINTREYVLKRIHNEGHAIGLHSYTHNFKEMYKNEKIFMNEMKWTSNKVKKVTGVDSNIIRFPGGTIETKNNKIISMAKKKGYKIYDWNTEAGDGMHPNLSPKKVYSNSLKVYGDKNNVILLMHCRENNKNTVKALPVIVEYYKSKGYKFCIISENTPQHCFRRR